MSWDQAMQAHFQRDVKLSEQVSGQLVRAVWKDTRAVAAQL